MPKQSIKIPCCHPFTNEWKHRFAVRFYGGLVPQLTINDFFLGVSALRNPELMRILKDLELVEALGFGIRGITKIYDRSIFEFTDNTIYVQFPFEKEVVESETESKEISKGKILELISNDSKISVPEIAEIVGLSIKGVEKNIRQLKQEGIISRTSETKSGEWIIKI
ncbi:MAG: winged helix-turn-helix transcriptional regulator [Paludibacter sp.]|nr:winged helix-turn-helix transcriptional regulator [Paludibacter sp.]